MNHPFGRSAVRRSFSIVTLTSLLLSLLFGVQVARADTVVNTVSVSASQMAVNPVTGKVYTIASISTGNVNILDGATDTPLPLPHTISTGLNPTAMAVNPATNKIYVSNSASGNVTVIDGGTATATNVGAGTTPSRLAVNPLQGSIYVANLDSDSVTVIHDQPGTGPPLTTAITPEGTAAHPAFHFAAASSYPAPGGPAPTGIYYQVDTITGPWQAAGSGASGATGPLSLLPGEHVIYAFATDGQDATSINTGTANGSVPGQIAAYNFVVMPPDGAGTLALTPPGAPPGTAQDLTFTYTAGVSGLAGGEIDIALPPGFSGGTASASHGTATITGGALQVSGINLGSGATMTITDAAGNVGTAPALTVLVVPAVSIDTPDGARFTSSQPVLTGTAQPGTTLRVRIDGLPRASVTPDAAGHWSYTPPLIAPGSHSVGATATDAAGITGTAAPHQFTVITLTDIDGDPAREAVTALVGQGIFTGFPDGSFQPNQRQIPVPGPAPAISDQLPDWAADAIHVSTAAGLLSPSANGIFAPAAPATRGQTAQAFYHLLALLQG